jgi:hypothetical protein
MTAEREKVFAEWLLIVAGVVEVAMLVAVLAA